MKDVFLVFKINYLFKVADINEVHHNSCVEEILIFVSEWT